MDSTESNRTHSTKNQSSKSQKHNDDEFEEKDNEKRRKSGGSGRAGSRDEGDHDSRREPNPKIPRKSGDDVRSSESYRDKEYDSGSKNRDDGRESNSSGKSSRSRGKPESHHEDNRYSERKEGSSREKGHRAERLGMELRIEDEDSRGPRERDAEASEKEEKVRQQRGSGNDNGDEIDMDEVGSTWMKERSGRDVRHGKRSGTPERSEWHHRDGRMRSEDGKASSSFRDAREKSDSIEIKPEKNVDFGREEADSFENYGRDSLDSQDGKERGQKGPMDSNCTGAGQSNCSGSQPPFWNNQGSGSFNRGSQQGPKGGRPARGGRTTGRDVQRVGTPLPMMPPPFGPPGLTSGPLQPIGSPGLLFPPLQGPIVWTMPPPGSMAPRFSPMYFNQPGLGRGAPPNTPGPGFDSPVPVSREAQQDKSPMGWATPRNYVPPGRAPSRGEQNDYSQNFVDTGMRPQNFIRELELTSTVEDYPKLRDLIQRKDEIVAKSASPPMYYKCDLHDFALTPEFFGTKFDVILVDPPWEEYVHRAPGVTDHLEYWPFEEIQNLKIEAIADTPSFIFLWVGDGVGLEQGRQCLKKWGFRRCEDICWVKTNKRNATPGLRHDSRTLFQHSKEHCLMGIKGTVRRSTDGHIIHANIDTDVIIAEEPSDGSTKKPEDMYRIIEHFALGKRRLELFGEDHNIRSGWLTLGKGLSSSNFNPEAYIRNFADKDGKVWQGGGGRNPPPETGHLVLTTPEIESLRPKSPPPKNQQQQQPSGSHSGLNQDTSVSGPATPAHWASSPMVGSSQGTEGGEHGVSGEKMDDGYRFNASIIRAVGDHIEIDPRRAVNNMT